MGGRGKKKRKKKKRISKKKTKKDNRETSEFIQNNILIKIVKK